MDQPSSSKMKNVETLNNKSCLVCQKILGEDDDKLRSDDFLPMTVPQTKFSDALMKFSNFREKDIVEGSTQVCAACFSNADMILSFIYVCNKSAQNFKSYMQSKSTSTDSGEIQLDTNNPFHKYKLVELCIACNIQIKKPKRLSISTVFERVFEQKVNLWDVLDLLTNFHELGKTDVPPHVCQHCFDTAGSALRFQNLCNVSVDQELSEVGKIGKLIAQRSAINVTDTPKEYGKYDKLNCKKCNKQFIKKQTLLKHLLNKHNIRFKCKFCEQMFSSAPDLQNHVDRHKTDVFCKICSKRCRNEKLLEIHMKNHEQYEYFLQCWHCLERFTKKKYFRKHIVNRLCQKRPAREYD